MTTRECIITDLEMQEMTGRQIRNLLRARGIEFEDEIRPLGVVDERHNDKILCTHYKQTIE